MTTDTPVIVVEVHSLLPVKATSYRFRAPDGRVIDFMRTPTREDCLKRILACRVLGEILRCRCCGQEDARVLAMDHDRGDRVRCWSCLGMEVGRGLCEHPEPKPSRVEASDDDAQRVSVETLVSMTPASETVN